MAAKDWDLTESGTIALDPLTDWRVARMGMLVAMRLSVARLRGAPPTPEVADEQLGMTAEEARRLGQALCLAADRIADQGQGTA